jgi:hypothetical protein
MARRFSRFVIVADFTAAIWYSLRLMQREAAGSAVFKRMKTREAGRQKRSDKRFPTTPKRVTQGSRNLQRSHHTGAQLMALCLHIIELMKRLRVPSAVQNM